MTTATNDKLAFVFPGQGSQSLGMLADLGARHRIVRQVFEEAGEALGADLWKLCQDGPEDELNRTENTQPALLTAGVACWRLWEESSRVRPAVLAGHSLGEYTALVAAGALSLEDGVRLVAERGRQMQRAVPAGEGAMAAIIGLEDADVDAACREASGTGVVTPANFNAPGQVVIAGAADAVDQAIEAAKARGARRAMKLPVSVPSHCELMRPAAEGLAPSLEAVTIESPAIPVVHNADVSAHADAADIRAALLAQLHSPVRWTDTVRDLAGRGVADCVECGPDRVLAGLIRRTAKELGIYNLGEPASFDETVKAFGQA